MSSWSQYNRTNSADFQTARASLQDYVINTKGDWSSLVKSGIRELKGVSKPALFSRNWICSIFPLGATRLGRSDHSSRTQVPIKQEHQRSFRGRGPVIKEFRSGLFVVGTGSKPRSDPATRRPLQVQAKRLPLQQSTLQIFFLCLRSQSRPRSLMALVFFCLPTHLMIWIKWRKL